MRIMKVIRETNAYITHDAPWNLTDPAQADQKNACIYMCAESLRICGILLQPYMPEKMKQLLDTLGGIRGYTFVP